MEGHSNDVVRLEGAEGQFLAVNPSLTVTVGAQADSEEGVEAKSEARASRPSRSAHRRKKTARGRAAVVVAPAPDPDATTPLLVPAGGSPGSGRKKSRTCPSCPAPATLAELGRNAGQGTAAAPLHVGGAGKASSLTLRTAAVGSSFGLTMTHSVGPYIQRQGQRARANDCARSIRDVLNQLSKHENFLPKYFQPTVRVIRFGPGGVKEEGVPEAVKRTVELAKRYWVQWVSNRISRKVSDNENVKNLHQAVIDALNGEAVTVPVKKSLTMPDKTQATSFAIGLATMISSVMAPEVAFFARVGSILTSTFLSLGTKRSDSLAEEVRYLETAWYEIVGLIHLVDDSIELRCLVSLFQEMQRGISRIVVDYQCASQEKIASTPEAEVVSDAKAELNDLAMQFERDLDAKLAPFIAKLSSLQGLFETAREAATASFVFGSDVAAAGAGAGARATAMPSVPSDESVEPIAGPLIW